MCVTTYVINLARSVERRAHMTAQLAKAALPYEFVDAVDARTLSSAEFAHLVDPETLKRNPPWLPPGAVGCALSHLRTYERMLGSSDDVSLVLEDDVVLPPMLDELIASIIPCMWGAEVVLLYFRSFPDKGICEFSLRDATVCGEGSHRIVYPMDLRPLGTASGYLITREAASRLAQVILPVRVAADGWAEFYQFGALTAVRCVLPRVLSVRHDFRTTLEHAAPSSLRARTAELVARDRLFPFYQVLQLKRSFVRRRTSRVAHTAERSPIAIARDGLSVICTVIGYNLYLINRLSSRFG